MDSVSVNQFRDKLKAHVEKVINENIPLRVTRRNGNDFVVISAEDWEREQETLYVLQNASLVQKIAQSTETHHQNQGYSPTKKEVNEILGF
jgi:antitoxin YefM